MLAFTRSCCVQFNPPNESCCHHQSPLKCWASGKLDCCLLSVKIHSIWLFCSEEKSKYIYEFCNVETLYSWQLEFFMWQILLFSFLHFCEISFQLEIFFLPTLSLWFKIFALWPQVQVSQFDPLIFSVANLCLFSL